MDAPRPVRVASVLSRSQGPMAGAVRHLHADERPDQWILSAVLPPLILMWVLWFTPNEGWWHKVAAVAAAGELAVLVLLPPLLTYQRVHERTGLARSNDETLLFSADVSGLLERPDPIGRLELSRCRASPRRTAVSRADRRRADRGRLVPRDMVTAQTRTWRSPDHQAQRRFRDRRVYWGDRRSRPHRAVAGATTWRIPPPLACRPHARP